MSSCVELHPSFEELIPNKTSAPVFAVRAPEVRVDPYAVPVERCDG
jgi:hypothetical protein